jgi:WD40 repeat protein
VTALEYVLGGFQNKNVLGVGWNRKVTFWEDAPEKKVVPAGRMLSGHADDILCISLQLPSTLATGSYDGVVIVWNIDSGAIKLKLQVGLLYSLLVSRLSPMPLNPCGLVYVVDAVWLVVTEGFEKSGGSEATK